MHRAYNIKIANAQRVRSVYNFKMRRFCLICSQW